MTVWTREQVAQVRGLRGEVEVDMTHPEVDLVLEEARDQVVRQLSVMATAFAVDVDPRDFRSAEVFSDDRLFITKIRCWWEPETRVVEFHGGQNDGVVLEVEKPGMTILLAEMQGIDWSTTDTAPTELLTPMGVPYNLTGWDETNRRWVYTRS